MPSKPSVAPQQTCSVKFCLLDADYTTDKESGKTIVKLIGIDEQGNSILVLDSSFEPYFYILSKKGKKKELIEKLEKSSLVTRIDEVSRIVEGNEEKVLQVFVIVPASTGKVRESVKRLDSVKGTYEYSVNFYKRYMMNRGIYPLDWLEIEGEEIENETAYKKVVKAVSIKKMSSKELPTLNVLAFDTEVVDKKLIMISFVAKNFKKVLTYKKAKNAEVCKDEKQMLQRFVEIVNEQDPDVIVTFNGDQFDFEVIRQRADELNVPLKLNRDASVLKGVRRGQTTAARLQGRIHIDLFPFIDTVLAPQLQFEAITLNDVSEELLGESKTDMSFEGMLQSWKSGKMEDVVKYCLNDSKLTIKLAEILLPQVLELSRASGQLPFDSSRMAYGTLVESFFLRKGVEHNTLAPEAPHFAEVEKRRRQRPYVGGYVKEPKVGLHENIAVFDFRSLYPSIIVTYNLSPETYNCKHKDCKTNKVPDMKHHFCTKIKGFIPTHLKSILEHRQEIKSRMKNYSRGSAEWKQLDEEQKAIKILANATYGYLAYAGSRWYSREAAESAAAYGRYHIQQTIKDAEKTGFEVLYADTDSVFVKTKKGSIEKLAEDFQKKINKSLPGILELELQGIYTRGLFVPQKIGTYTAKKRYALIDENGEVTVRGFEAVRRDWCDMAKDLQHNVLRLVLQNNQSEAVKKVKHAVEKIKKRKVTISDIAVRTMLGKELTEYKATGPHIAVARKLQKQGHEMPQGTVISYIITKGAGSISQRAEPTDKISIKDYDIDYYLHNQILAVALRVLGSLGYKEEDLCY